MQEYLGQIETEIGAAIGTETDRKKDKKGQKQRETDRKGQEQKKTDCNKTKRTEATRFSKV